MNEWKIEGKNNECKKRIKENKRKCTEKKRIENRKESEDTNKLRTIGHVKISWNRTMSKNMEI